VLCCLLGGLGWCASSAVQAARPDHVELQHIEARRADGGVTLSFETRFELPPGVEGALQHGVALYFVAEVELQRPRWFWFDKTLVEARRVWRLSYQPLTQNYRIGLGGLSQTHATLAEALRAVQRSRNWQIAESLPAGLEEVPLVLNFNYRLDVSQLPRPMQLTISSRPEWHLQIDRSVDLAPIR
jgi:hypothetical protein